MRKRKVLLLVSISLFIGAGIILLVPSLFKKQVSDLLRKEINENIIGNVSFSDADVNLWRHFPHFTITLEDFVLSGKKQFHGDTLLKTKELHLVFGTLKLLASNEIEIRELNLDEPQFHILRLKDGKFNYDILKNSDTDTDQTDEIKLEIEGCKIENGKFLFEDQELGLQLKGTGLSITGIGDINGSVYDLDVVAGITSFTSVLNKKTYVKNKNIAFDLEAVYDIRNNRFEFKDNLIKINHLELGMEGAYQWKEEGHFVDVKFHSADTDFKDFLSLSDELFSKDFKGVSIQGHLNLNGFVKGIYNSDRNAIPAFKVDFQVMNGLFKNDGFSSSINAINFDLTAENKDGVWQNTVLDLRNFEMNLGRNPFKGYCKINGFENGHIKSDIIAQVNLADLKTIHPLPGVSLNGSLEFDLKADGPFSGSLNQLTYQTKHKNERIPPFNLSLNIKDGSFKYDHLPEAINNINLHLTGKNTSGKLDHTSMRIENLEATFGDNPLKGFIHVVGIEDPVINSEIRANINLAEIKNFYPVEGLQLEGLFDMDLKVSGQLSDSLKKFPMIDSRIRITDAFVKSDDYPFPMENTYVVLEAINNSGKLKDTHLIIDTLMYSIEDEFFFIRGNVSDLEKYAYDVTVKGTVYLDKLSKILLLDDKVKMTGEIDMDFKTAGNYNDLKLKKYHKLPTSGQVLLSNVFLQNEDLPHGLSVEAGHFYFSNEKIFLDTLHGSVGKSNFNLSGHLYNYMAYLLHSDEKIKGDLLFESDTFNINELMSEEKLEKHDTVHHDLAIIKIPDNIDFTFNSRINHLLYKDLVVNNLNGEISISDGVLTLAETKFDALGATFDLSGDYDSRDADHPLFDMHVKIDQLDINKAHHAFVTVQTIAPAAEDTYGVFSLEYALKGELSHNMYPVFESLKGGGTVTIHEAKVNGMKVFHHISGITKKEELMNPELKDIVMETTVDEGIIYVKPFSMKLAGFATDIEGRHNIHGSMSYVLKMAIPPFDIVKIPLHVNGTYDKPRIHLGKGHEETFKKITMLDKP